MIIADDTLEVSTGPDRAAGIFPEGSKADTIAFHSFSDSGGKPGKGHSIKPHESMAGSNPDVTIATLKNCEDGALTSVRAWRPAAKQEVALSWSLRFRDCQREEHDQRELRTPAAKL